MIYSGDLWSSAILDDNGSDPIELAVNMKKSLTNEEAFAHIPPEVFEGYPLTTAVDIYSFGMCVIEMLARDEMEPYKECNNDYIRIQRRVMSGELPDILGRIVNQEAVDFISACLRPVKERPTAEKLLEHQFLVGIDEDDSEVELSSSEGRRPSTSSGHKDALPVDETVETESAIPSMDVQQNTSDVVSRDASNVAVTSDATSSSTDIVGSNHAALSDEVVDSSGKSSVSISPEFATSQPATATFSPYDDASPTQDTLLSLSATDAVSAASTHSNQENSVECTRISSDDALTPKPSNVNKGGLDDRENMHTSKLPDKIPTSSQEDKSGGSSPTSAVEDVSHLELSQQIPLKHTNSNNSTRGSVNSRNSSEDNGGDYDGGNVGVTLSQDDKTIAKRKLIGFDTGENLYQDKGLHDGRRGDDGEEEHKTGDDGEEEQKGKEGNEDSQNVTPLYYTLKAECITHDSGGVNCDEYNVHMTMPSNEPNIAMTEIDFLFNIHSDNFHTVATEMIDELNLGISVDDLASALQMELGRAIDLNNTASTPKPTQLPYSETQLANSQSNSPKVQPVPTSSVVETSSAPKSSVTLLPPSKQQQIKPSPEYATTSVGNNNINNYSNATGKDKTRINDGYIMSPAGAQASNAALQSSFIPLSHATHTTFAEAATVSSVQSRSDLSPIGHSVGFSEGDLSDGHERDGETDSPYIHGGSVGTRNVDYPFDTATSMAASSLTMSESSSISSMENEREDPDIGATNRHQNQNHVHSSQGLNNEVPPQLDSVASEIHAEYDTGGGENVENYNNETASPSITEITNVDTATVGDRSSNATHAAVVQVRFKNSAYNARDGDANVLRDDDDKSLSTLTAGGNLSIINTVLEMEVDTIDIEKPLPDTATQRHHLDKTSSNAQGDVTAPNHGNSDIDGSIQEEKHTTQLSVDQVIGNNGDGTSTISPPIVNMNERSDALSSKADLLVSSNDSHQIKADEIVHEVLQTISKEDEELKKADDRKALLREELGDDQSVYIAEIEKLEKEYRIARKTYEQRIQKHKIIQETCEQDIANNFVDRDTKLVSIDKKSEQMEKNRRKDLLKLQDEFERAIEDYIKNKMEGYNHERRMKWLNEHNGSNKFDTSGIIVSNININGENGEHKNGETTNGNNRTNDNLSGSNAVNGTSDHSQGQQQDFNDANSAQSTYAGAGNGLVNNSDVVEHSKGDQL